MEPGANLPRQNPVLFIPCHAQSLSPTYWSSYRRHQVKVCGWVNSQFTLSLSLRTTYSEPGKLSTKYDHSEFCKIHKLTKTKTLNGTMNLMVFYIIKSSSPRVLSLGYTKTTGCQTYKTH